MASAEIARNLRIFCKRQKDGRGGETLVLYYYCSVMKWRRRIKDRHDEVIADAGIDLHPRVDKISQPYIALDDYKSADLLGRQRRHREYDLVINAAAKLPSLFL